MRTFRKRFFLVKNNRFVALLHFLRFLDQCYWCSSVRRQFERKKKFKIKLQIMTFETLEFRIGNSIVIPFPLHLLHSNTELCSINMHKFYFPHTKKQFAKQIFVAWNYSFWNFLSTFFVSALTDSSQNAVANKFKASYVRSNFAATFKRLLYIFSENNLICAGLTFDRMMHVVFLPSENNAPFVCNSFFGRLLAVRNR